MLVRAANKRSAHAEWQTHYLVVMLLLVLLAVIGLSSSHKNTSGYILTVTKLICW